MHFLTTFSTTPCDTKGMKTLALALTLSLSAVAQAPPHTADTLVFQTQNGWSPRVNVEAGTVMVYGLHANLPDRIRSWKEHGYRVTVMTGVAWGEYGDYLRGDFDGKEHWNETQQESDGKLIQHGGREVPYVAPSESYGKYLSQGVLHALDAGAEAIYLEEPEFWARAGWSDSFKNEWQSYYHEPWRAPDSSPDAQYRTSKLKYFLYQRALAQVFTAVRQWSQEHNKQIPCYVATHSLINYAQWQIVSPESSLLDVGADGYIAQVWTGTSRAVKRLPGCRGRAYLRDGIPRVWRAAEYCTLIRQTHLVSQRSDRRQSESFVDRLQAQLGVYARRIPAAAGSQQLRNPALARPHLRSACAACSQRAYRRES